MISFKIYKMLNKYFRRPLTWDYLIASFLCYVAFKLYELKIIILPKDDYTLSTASDLSTIALTLAGFILTLLTVLITFKSGSRVTKSNANEDDTVFEMFFASDLYFDTVKHLKNCIKSLIVISIIGYSLKLFLHEDCQKYIFFFNVAGLIVIVLTLWRSLLILVKVIDLQKNDAE